MPTSNAPTKQQISTNNLIIVLMLVSLLVIGIAGLVSKTLVSTILLDKKVYSAKVKADKQLTVDLDAAPKLVDAYAALGSQAGVLEDALPNTADFPSLIVLMENIAATTGVKLKTVSPSTTVSSSASGGSTTTTGTADTLAPTPQPYAFTIAVDCNYAQVIQLLGALEKSARPMRITSMNLAGSGSVLSAQLTIETYYQGKAQLPFGKETIK